MKPIEERQQRANREIAEVLKKNVVAILPAIEYTNNGALIVLKIVDAVPKSTIATPPKEIIKA